MNTAIRSAVNVDPYHQTAPPHTTAIKSSTSGYWIEIRDRHPAQRPPRNIQPKIGMFSYDRIGRSHLGQRDRGETTDNCCGQREIQTFRNEPIHAPTSVAKITASEFVIIG
jgi:hypothetical protein